ncbi:peptide/nickel transport system permease protein [Paenibacillus sp. UNCCL117]|uniref:ABC transporter permease n=1 Tax=unclassified Paenibacillus TaxID=185978 RepID=UPI00088FCDCD|nr:MULTISPECIES: ABC transporter permease [unclassified Paenibacillus]SDC89793.1 peptide/nickel transport system permease protein [Paenibacillus sp. cl123]SFW28649.1 peptide/nickel transport system permease protein [Paenibacillus sp. UNCCL117]
MAKLFLRKLLGAFITLFGATLILFVLIRLAPGDPVKLLLGYSTEVAMSNTEAYEQRVTELRMQLGLDQPMAGQYASWVMRLLQGDLGTSIQSGRAVGTEMAERLPATAILSVSALTIQVVLGLFFGTVSALKAGKVQDNVIRLACVGLASTPAFVLGLVLLSLFAVTMPLYEISSEASLARLWLPAVTLGLIGAPQLIRIIRANLLSELGQTYVLSASSRGLDRQRVVRHALRNALLPVVTMAGLALTGLISGAVVIESIFSWPGIGKYALDSILLKDYPVIQGYALVMVSLVILIHLLVDVMYVWIDPRIHRRGEADAHE